MPKFRVVTTATATIREEWIVDAQDADDACDLDNATFVTQEVVGDEHDRTVNSVTITED